MTSVAEPVLMPKLGLTMEEGLLASWSVAPGEPVKQGAVLFVVETDKIATEVVAERELIIESILVPAGDTVSVGTIVATFLAGSGSDRAGPGPLPEAAEGGLAAAPPSTVTPREDVAAGHPGQGRILATPLARRVSRQHGVDLAALSGSGPRDRIKHVDVVRYLEGSARDLRKPGAQPGLGHVREPTSIERSIARRLTEAKQSIPHFYVMATADVTDLLAFRQALNQDADFPRITISHMLLMAIVRSLAILPEFNTIWADDMLVTLGSIDVGIAVDTPNGLFAPVVKDLGGKSLSQIVVLADALIESARAGRLRHDQLTGGAISISNVGMFGAAYLVPIVNPAQSAILGVGGTNRVFRPDAKGAPTLREEIGLTLSCDHRVHSGAGAARFLNKLVSILETPARLLRT